MTNTLAYYKSFITFVPDLHSGPRVDLPTILSHLGQKMVLMGLKGKSTTYPEANEVKNVEIYSAKSPVLSKYNTHSTPLSHADIDSNREFYSKDATVASIDAFVCTFPGTDAIKLFTVVI
jgi:hypothetical protein